jgi:hypothetical protein
MAYIARAVRGRLRWHVAVATPGVIMISVHASSSGTQALSRALFSTALALSFAACDMESSSSAESSPSSSVELPSLAVPLQGSEATARNRPRPPSPPASTDPLFAAVLGHWAGHCDVFLPGVDEPAFSVDVERISERTADPSEITWTLIYHTATTDIRNYFMRKDPAQPGRYLLDEKNGIVLTSYMHTDDLMINDFEGLGFRLRGREEYSRNRYDFEFVTSAITPEITSEIRGIPFYAYQVLSTQRCSMRRVGHRD